HQRDEPIPIHGRCPARSLRTCSASTLIEPRVQVVPSVRGARRCARCVIHVNSPREIGRAFRLPVREEMVLARLWLPSSLALIVSPPSEVGPVTPPGSSEGGHRRRGKGPGPVSG